MSEHEEPTDRTQCNHWNDRVGSVPLRPLRCLAEMGHRGDHYCGSTSWSEALGFRVDPSEERQHE